MPSEYTPWWSGARMSAAQIKKLQNEQKLARELAESKLKAAQQSEEWKKEQKILAELEQKLETWDIDDIKIS